MRTRGEAGVKNPENFAVVLYELSLRMGKLSFCVIQGFVFSELRRRLTGLRM